MISVKIVTYVVHAPVLRESIRSLWMTVRILETNG